MGRAIDAYYNAKWAAAWVCRCLFALCFAVGDVHAEEPPDELKSLLDRKVYTASRKEEDLSKSASPTYVITAEDIKQRGVRHWQDALRGVPGLQVSKIASNKWMIASRGFGEQFSNKLLVLVDDRPIYTPLFSGALWDQQDVPIENIKQIEVIRGPGAALWGSNAVNGVINIITKSAHETTGTAINQNLGVSEFGEWTSVTEGQNTIALGNEGAFQSNLRFSRDGSYEPLSSDAGYDDAWHNASANFRYDSAKTPIDSLTVKGNIFTSAADQSMVFPDMAAPFARKTSTKEDSEGGYLQAIYGKNLDQDDKFTVRSFIDYTHWEYIEVDARFLNAGIETQYDTVLFGDWETVGGVGYKISSDDIRGTELFSYSTESETAHFFDAFFQTKIPLITNEVFVTLGGRLESNTYETFAASPNAKLAWTPTPFFMSWLSWAQAQRIPSRGTDALTTVVGANGLGYVALLPNDDFKSEKLNSYEAGIRVNPLPGFNLDTALFYNDYTDLRTFLPGPPVGAIAFARYIGNDGEATNRGVEVAASYQTSTRFKLTGSYSYHELDFSTNGVTADAAFLSSADKWPVHMWSAHLMHKLADDWRLNVSGYYSGSMPAIAMQDYTKIDTNIVWSPTDKWELILGIDNLTDGVHQEYSQQIYGVPAQVPRLYYMTFKIAL